MITISIIRNSAVTNQASFPSQEEAQAWYDSHLAMGSFGNAASSHTILVELTPAVLDENGVEIQAATFEDQIIQVAGHSVEFLDVSAQLAQEAVNAAALKYLADTDWMVIRESEGGVACPQGIKDLRAAARLSIVR